MATGPNSDGVISTYISFCVLDTILVVFPMHAMHEHLSNIVYVYKTCKRPPLPPPNGHERVGARVSAFCAYMFLFLLPINS